jgi:uncharacterized protein YecT (DUF1311 family)
MRAVMTTLLAVSAAGALFAISILQAHSQSPGALQEQGFVPRGSERPSFDCAQAKTAAARLICADGELARLDGELGAALQKRNAQLSSADHSRFVVDQLAWIRDRNERCGLVAKNSAVVDELIGAKPCMVNLIRQRIAGLTRNESLSSSGCYNDGDVITVQGAAAAQPLKLANGQVTQGWFLITDRPICLIKFTGGNNASHEISLSRLQIVGQPPPVGVSIELTGRISAGNISRDTDSTALVVIRGHRIAAATAREVTPTSPALTNSSQTPASLSDYAKHIKHRWVKYAEDGNQTSYIDLASVVRTGDTLTVLDMQDLKPPIERGVTGEYFGSTLGLVKYDCGSTPRSMIMADVPFHGNMGSGTALEGFDDVPKEPSDGWRVLDGRSSAMLKARDMACNGISTIQSTTQAPTWAPSATPYAHAIDPRCNAPPYGGTDAGYQSFVLTLGRLLDPASPERASDKLWSAICKAKFGGLERTGLYNLGFTDAQINATNVDKLAVDMLKALKNLADSLPVR